MYDHFVNLYPQLIKKPSIVDKVQEFMKYVYSFSLLTDIEATGPESVDSNGIFPSLISVFVSQAECWSCSCSEV